MISCLCQLNEVFEVQILNKYSKRKKCMFFISPLNFLSPSLMCSSALAYISTRAHVWIWWRTMKEILIGQWRCKSKVFVLITIKLQINDKSTFYETTTLATKVTWIVDKKSLKTTIHWIDNISRAGSLLMILVCPQFQTNGFIWIVKRKNQSIKEPLVSLIVYFMMV